MFDCRERESLTREDRNSNNHQYPKLNQSAMTSQLRWNERENERERTREREKERDDVQSSPHSV